MMDLSEVMVEPLRLTADEAKAGVVLMVCVRFGKMTTVMAQSVDGLHASCSFVNSDERLARDRARASVPHRFDDIRQGIAARKAAKLAKYEVA